jgi:phosphoglycolate phosphatase-like HAD superfamily hydrolase
MVPAEVVNPRVRRGPFGVVLFDFDGTLSLIREGWPRVMVGMMCDHLHELGLAREPAAELWATVERFVMVLNGHPSVVQMARFAEEVRLRGGTPADPRVYLDEYTTRLMAVVRQRWELLESGRVPAAEWVVPNAHAVLRNLERRSVPVFVASGTDYESVIHEAELLGLTGFFNEHFYAPKGGDAAFTKAETIARMLGEFGVPGDRLLGFGDGVVETQAVKAAGGVAVGVASAEPGQTGVNPDKRARLVAAGADLVIPDYAGQEALIAWLWGEG